MNVTDKEPAPPSAKGHVRPDPAASLSAAAQTAGRSLRRAAIVAVAFVIAGAVFGLVPRWRDRAALRAQTADLALATVSIVSPAPGQAGPLLTLPAEIKPLVEAPIYARASGYLKRWLVDIGAEVKEGELLAEIDTPELNQELAQARAQLAQAEAALELAKTTGARWAELVKTASVSEQEALEKKADLELKAATVEAAKANVRRLQDLQGFQRVTAPFAGIVTVRGTDLGQLIAAGSGKELFRLAQTSRLRVYVRVPQTAAGGITPGQSAELTIPELPGRVFPAKVVRTSGAMSADSRTLLTELEVDNPKGEILAGTYAQVRFADLKANPLLTLPGNTLLFRPEGPQVAVVGAGDKVEMRSVSLGRDFGSSIEVLDGIGPADRVILNPPDSIVSGVTVRVASAASAPAGVTEATQRAAAK